MHPYPYLGPGFGHTLKFGVGALNQIAHLIIGVLSSAQKGIFDHLGGDGPLFRIGLDGALRNTHIALNGTGNAGGVLQDGVELLTPEGTGGHGLGELEHGGRLALRRSAADDKLLVDLFHESDELIIAFKGGARIGSHTGDGGGGVQVGRPGALGGGHDFLLQLINGASIIHYEIEAGRGAGQLVRQPQERFCTGSGGQCGHNAFDLAQQSIRRIGAVAEALVEDFLLLCRPAVALRHLVNLGVGLHQRRSGRLDFCRVHSTPGGPLDLLKGIEGGVERRVDFSEHAADTVIEDHLRSDCCHKFTPSFKN